MKTFLTLTLLLVATAAFSKSDLNVPIPFDSVTQKYTYTEVVPAEGKAESELYQRARDFLVQRFVATKPIVEDLNVLFLKKGSFEVMHYYVANEKYGMNYTVSFTIELGFKPGRFRYKITDIILSQNAATTTYEITLETWIGEAIKHKGAAGNAVKERMGDTLKRMHEKFLKLIQELKSKIIDEKAKDDW